MSMKKSFLAKLLIVILCLSLVLCGCSGAADNKDDGKNDDKTSNQGDGNKNDDDKGNKEEATPEEKAEAAIGNTLSAIFSSDVDLGILEDAMECGKVTISMGDYIENVLYINTNDFNVADQLSLNIEGAELGAELYVNDEDLVIAVPGILDGAYGISFDTLASDLEDSLMWEMMGLDYDEVMGQLNEYLEGLDGMLGGMDSSMNDLAGALEEALDYVDRDITEGIAKVNGKDVPAVIVTYTITSDNLHKMLNVMIDWFEGCAEEMGLEDTMESAGMGRLSDTIGEMKSSMDEFFKEGTMDVELVVNVNAETGYIMTADASVVGAMEGEESTILMNVNLGEDVTKSDEYTLTVSSTFEDETMDILEIALERDSNGSEISYDFSVYSYDAEVFAASFEYDSASYEYNLSVKADESAVTIEGTYKLTDDEFEFFVDYIEVDGESMDIGLLVTAEPVSASEIPDAPEYKNILTMTEDEWNALLEVLNSFSGE